MELKFRYPDKPIETTPEHVQSLSGLEWIAQCKYDGWRMPIFVDSAYNARFLTRMGRPIASRTKFPSDLLLRLLELNFPDGTVLDAEFVGPRGGHEPKVYLFDCLAWEGQWLMNVAFEQRWQRLTRFLHHKLRDNGVIQLAHTVIPTDASSKPFTDLFDSLKSRWIAQGGGMDDLYEGIVLKRRQGVLTLNAIKSVEVGSMMKVKYRDIRDERY